MTVDVFTINAVGAGIPPVTRYVDSFNRASGNLGINWIQLMNGMIPIVNPICTATFTIGSCVDVQQGVIMTQFGTLNPGMYYAAGLIAAPIYITNWGRSQYSQWLMIIHDQTGANDAGAGPAVLLQNPGNMSQGQEQNGMYAYFIIVAASTKNWTLFRGNYNPATHTALASGGPLANGDTLRLEARCNVSDTTLTFKRNGVTQTTFVDNSPQHFQTGSPGFMANAFDQTGGGSMTSQWRNFDGGLL